MQRMKVKRIIDQTKKTVNAPIIATSKTAINAGLTPRPIRSKGQVAFDLIPAIVMTVQVGILIGMMVTSWFSKSPLEMPYDFRAPAGSLVLGIFMMVYNGYKHNLGLVPLTVLIVNALWNIVFMLLIGLARAFPERECCCPGGVKPEKVHIGECAKAADGSA